MNEGDFMRKENHGVRVRRGFKFWSVNYGAPKENINNIFFLLLNNVSVNDKGVNNVGNQIFSNFYDPLVSTLDYFD